MDSGFTLKVATWVETGAVDLSLSLLASLTVILGAIVAVVSFMRNE